MISDKLLVTSRAKPLVEAREWALRACADRPGDVEVMAVELKPQDMFLDDRTNKAINYVTVTLLIKDAE